MLPAHILIARAYVCKFCSNDVRWFASDTTALRRNINQSGSGKCINFVGIAGAMCPNEVAKHSVTMQADAVTSALVTAYTASRAIHDIDSITHNRVHRSRRAFERTRCARDGYNIHLPRAVISILT